MKNFKIKNEKKENIIFTFKDEQEDIIILKDEKDIINYSKEINSGRLSIELNLEIYQYNKKNKNNIINEEKNKEIKIFKNINLKEIKKLVKKLEEKDNEIKDLKNSIFNFGNDYTNKINKMKLLMKNEFKDIIINYINNERMNKSINNNENNEKDILEKKICIIENKLQNILSQIKDIDSKISKPIKDEIILKKKDDAMKTILQKEKKNYEIANKIQFEINQKNVKIKKDGNEKPNYFNIQKQKQENKVMEKLKNHEEINKNEINDKVINNNENEENIVLKEEIELTNRLKQFFYNENGELNKAEVNFHELEEMKEYYKSLLDKNKNIEDIKEYQNNYIELAIEPQRKLVKRERFKQAIKGRIEKFKNILDKLKKERESKSN